MLRESWRIQNSESNLNQFSAGRKKKLKNMSAEKNIYKEKDKIKNRISQETSFRLATLHV